MFELKGVLSLHAQGRALGGLDRVELLDQIGKTGSISAAARNVGMSYKGAWDAINAMNNLADEPLVERITGGKHGGGTTLTPRAQQLITVFRMLELQHQSFVKKLGTLGESSLRDIQLMRRFMVKTSARNHLAGRVVAVQAGAVNDVVELRLRGGESLVATVTSESTRELGLEPGREAIALIKASSVLVGLRTDSMRLSARNQLVGTVSALTAGNVNVEVTIRLPGGSVIVSMITKGSAGLLSLCEGMEVVAIIKASQVILGTID